MRVGADADHRAAEAGDEIDGNGARIEEACLDELLAQQARFLGIDAREALPYSRSIQALSDGRPPGPAAMASVGPPLAATRRRTSLAALHQGERRDRHQAEARQSHEDEDQALSSRMRSMNGLLSTAASNLEIDHAAHDHVADEHPEQCAAQDHLGDGHDSRCRRRRPARSRSPRAKTTKGVTCQNPGARRGPPPKAP